MGTGNGGFLPSRVKSKLLRGVLCVGEKNIEKVGWSRETDLISHIHHSLRSLVSWSCDSLNQKLSHNDKVVAGIQQNTMFAFAKKFSHLGQLRNACIYCSRD